MNARQELTISVGRPACKGLSGIKCYEFYMYEGGAQRPDSFIIKVSYAFTRQGMLELLRCPPGNGVAGVRTFRGRKLCEQSVAIDPKAATPPTISKQGFRSPEHQLVALVCHALVQDGPFVHS